MCDTLLHMPCVPIPLPVQGYIEVCACTPYNCNIHLYIVVTVVMASCCLATGTCVSMCVRALEEGKYLQSM